MRWALLIIGLWGCTSPAERMAEDNSGECLGCRDELSLCSVALEDCEAQRVRCEGDVEEAPPLELVPHLCRYRTWNEQCLRAKDAACEKPGKCGKAYATCSETHTRRVILATSPSHAESIFVQMYSCRLSPQCEFVTVEPPIGCTEPEGDAECRVFVGVGGDRE